MATLLLSAAGAAVGAGFGGTIMGLSGAVIGRAAGATLGRVIDARLAGRGSGVVERGRVERFRLNGAGEGQPQARVWGRARIAGHVIWASDFEERVSSGVQRGGKGGARTEVRAHSYLVSLALGLCEGPILSLGRIWADGQEIAPDRLNLRLYHGSEVQLPDPKIEAVEGAGRVPPFRGLAYVVLEDLDLAPFGNRVPQLSFEVVRAAAAGPAGLSDLVQAVALIPGCGEYALSTTPVHHSHGPGEAVSLNRHSPGARTDFSVSLAQLEGEMPRCEAVSLVVSWFGDDLRAGVCQIRPKVEQQRFEGVGQPWRAGGLTRAEAEPLAQLEGRAIYGGTPADAGVIEAITALKVAGQAVMFYPFVLMEQGPGNGRPDPWSGADDQPALPWRGRITLSVAPGRAGSPDGTLAAEVEVAAFLGSARPEDFTRAGGQVHYSGDPADFGYRRFILHYAHLCAEAGGVAAFCVGSELRGLTQIRGAAQSFPMVAGLRQLLGEVRAILGPECKLSYAADWSEYGGYSAPDGGRYFHLDPLWADPECDFIGIDNYMPLSDWRDGEDHADAAWGSPLNPAYLAANVAGGEGFDWYYDSPEARAAQRRTPITDGEGEPWIWRYKDLRAWWENAHFDRPGGLRSATAGPWVPRSKPVWFTELGVASIDRGANQPNLFLDPKSSESALPAHSSGRREEAMQTAYIRAIADHWGDLANNPLSELYGGPMVDLSRAFVWAWDARPWPWFPALEEVWADGPNHARGHWLNGRASHQPLAAVISEICARAGIVADVSRVFGVVQGWHLAQGGPARAALQDLCLVHALDAVEREGRLCFVPRSARVVAQIGEGDLALDPESGQGPEHLRAPLPELPGAVQVSFIEAGGSFAMASESASHPAREGQGASHHDLPMMLTRAEARALAERWLVEAGVAQDGLRLTLPPSKLHLTPGEVIGMGAAGRFRIDRAEFAGALSLEAVRVEPGLWQPSDFAEARARLPLTLPELPVWPLFLDLLAQEGQEASAAPWLAVSARPWGGPVGLWASDQDEDYGFEQAVSGPAIMGVTLSELSPVRAGLWDRGPALRLRLVQGALSSTDVARLLRGANLMAIGDGSPGGWEVMQSLQALPVAPQEWEFRWRLRGQAGSEARARAAHPAGSFVVLLDRALVRVGLRDQDLGRDRHYRIAPLRAGPGSDVARHVIARFDGRALQPLAPVHLRHRSDPAGDHFTWIRRSRLGGDDWSREVPLAEASERYRLRIRQGGELRFETSVTEPRWHLGAGLRAALGLSGAAQLHVAQISDRVGAGAEAVVSFGG